VQSHSKRCIATIVLYVSYFSAETHGDRLCLCWPKAIRSILEDEILINLLAETSTFVRPFTKVADLTPRKSRSVHCACMVSCERRMLPSFRMEPCDIY
jgi:hypothetical protein